MLSIVLGIAAVVLALAGVFVWIRIKKKRDRQYDFLEFKVINATGRNDDTNRRREVLQGIASRSKGFKKLKYELRHLKNGNQETFCVYAGECQIGIISQADVPVLLRTWNRIERVVSVNVFPIGDAKNFDVTATLKLRKEVLPK